ncbi:hypothetical protein SELMODRAFT_437767 [Selaginella moellendorffii]|uniref:glucan endo-1,3-beta-D-glucosidase n=1 Tax=Selaginella moellendorffii TaxID=88036 RepID=D8QTH6_SELML|nr:probable glucan endo-1,3-beta-glucosidase A6 [Selaginella moellendorffii]EFJ37114.1 hypothetical protein SELMODRAFT_437767 [Selaginella moellendorffii]|eukprot:XP_002961854.1 probable glucan endo-1,3-beta-glucosidase A6 [Selaginella moellendorffii]
MVVPLCVLLHICIAVNPPGSSTPGSGLDQIGVNYGRISDNIPSPNQTVALLKSMNVRLVKLFDANPQVLTALSNSSIRVTIMVPNEIIGAVASSQSSADDWIAQSVLPYYPSTQIIVIVVGNEIFSYPALAQTWQQLMPAIENLHRALQSHNLDDRIKITTSVAGDVLAASYPPSVGRFRPDIRDTVLKPLLGFLRTTRAPFYINLYPYFAWAGNPVNISLGYALFDPAATVVPDGKLRYTNLLDAMTDATFSAMEDLGFDDVELGISETGWPNAGDENERGATRSNAATYNRRLVRKVIEGRGTPKRPNSAIATFIFALYNENLKPGPGTERHWGLLYPDGRPVYSIDLTGRLSDSQYEAVPEPMSVAVVNSSSSSSSWCVARPDADTSSLQRELDRICSQNPSDCAAIQDGQSCFYPNTIIAHASYAFNRRWIRENQCSFSSTAALTKINPSYGSCIFPSSN